jgi:PilZ domain
VPSLGTPLDPCGVDLADSNSAETSTKGTGMRQWLAALSGRRREQPGQPKHSDRPQRQRIMRYFDCTWSGTFGEERARVSNISPTGCYVECRFAIPAQGDILNDLTVNLPSGALMVHGTVVDASPGLGFAVRFADLDAHALEYLNALVTTGTTHSN